MVVFSRWSQSFVVCAATGFLWSTLIKDEDSFKSQCQPLIQQAQLTCQAFKEKQGIPGVSIGLTAHGSMIWKQGFGLADIEQRVPCTSETVMRIASISKTFTSAVAARLVDVGKLKWDDPIRNYRADLPEFIFENSPVTITVRQLASHTSGIRHYSKKGDKENDDEFLLTEYYIKQFYATIDEALPLFVNDELIHRPGTTWLYTTHGYTLFSAILEGVVEKKQTFVELLNDLLTKQLALKNTKLEYPGEFVPNRSRYYWRKDLKTGLRHVNYVDLSYKWAGGGILSNVTDLLLFANTLLQCREKFNSRSSTNNRLISSDTLKEIWSPVISTNRKNMSYGLGWMIAAEQQSAIKEFSIPRHVFHTGGAVGATSILLIIPCPNNCSNPQCGVCLAILTNLHCAEEIYQTALDIALIFHRRFPCVMELKQ